MRQADRKPSRGRRPWRCLVLAGVGWLVVCAAAAPAPAAETAAMSSAAWQPGSPLAAVPAAAKQDVAVPAAAEQRAAVPAFSDVCFDDFHSTRRGTTAEDLQKLLRPIQGRISETASRKRMVGQISGTFRLVPPWQTDSVLRLELSEPKDVSLRFWNGDRGVTLRLYKSSGFSWAAYGTARRSADPSADRESLWALDNGRYERSGAGTFEVRCQGEHLVLSRGDLVLLCAPFRGTPSQVDIECASAKVIGMAMLRSGPVPLLRVARPAIRRISRPADVEWRTRLPEGATLVKLPDGRVELAVDARGDAKASNKTRGAPAVVACAGVDIDGPGLVEAVVEIDDPAPGTGVYLADGQGEHRQWLLFQHDRTGGQTVLHTCAPESRKVDHPRSSERPIIPAAGPQQWLRIVAGAGIVKYFVSGDGLDWSESPDSPPTVSGPCRQIGVFCLPDDRQKRSIHLRSLTIGRLDRLESLVPESLEDRVASLADVRSREEWEGRVGGSRPPDIEESLWRRACTLRSLAENVPSSIGRPLLLELMNDIAACPRDAQEKFRLLDEASLLFPSHAGRRDPESAAVAAAYERVGEQLRLSGDPAPFTATYRALLRQPLWTDECPFPVRLLWHETLMLAHSGRWREVDALFRQVWYWLGNPLPRERAEWSSPERASVAYLLEWAEAHARLNLAPPAGGEYPPMSRQWQHPLIHQLGKEAYNVMSEFRAALSGDAYRDACRILAAAAVAHRGELLPDPDDPRLLISMPQIVRLAMQTQPALQRTMQEEFGEQGKLRVGRAISENDPETVEAATLQFLGTEAAADAQQWLGDRALSGGKFDMAMRHYRLALPDAPPARRDALSARLRLAGAMLGDDFGSPATTPFAAGEVVLSPRDFEKLVERARKNARMSRSSAGLNSPDESGGPSPKPHPYEARPWARLDLAADRRPDPLPADSIDWIARSLAAAVVDGKLVVNSQVQQVAFDLESGQQVWRQQGAPVDKRPLWWSLSPMQPVVDRDRIYLRRFAGDGLELACLEARDGRTLWSTRPPDSRQNWIAPVVSDPIVAGSELLALTARREFPEQLVLELAAFDRERGKLRRQTPLATFRDRWDGALDAQWTTAENELIVSAGGAVLCADLSGRVRWIRRQPWAPPPRDASLAAPWLRQANRPPLVAGNRIYATQPGVWEIECVDLDTGRLCWTVGLPERRGMAGHVDNTIVAETADGLTAIEADWSTVVWQHPVERRLPLRICGDDSAVCYGQLDAPVGGGPPRVALTWIDSASGRLKSQSPFAVPGVSGAEAAAGPLVVHGARQWLFVGADRGATSREIVELARPK